MTLVSLAKILDASGGFFEVFPWEIVIENGRWIVKRHKFQVSVLVPFHLLALYGFFWKAFSGILAAMLSPATDGVGIFLRCYSFSHKESHMI